MVAASEEPLYWRWHLLESSYGGGVCRRETREVCRVSGLEWMTKGMGAVSGREAAFLRVSYVSVTDNQIYDQIG